jgi:uncharacterized protein
MPEPESLDAWTMVLLRRPASAPNMSEAELDALQERHLAFWDSLYGQGLLVHGPVRGQADESIRGFGIWKRPVDEVKALVDQDPSALAGRLVMEVFTWYTVPGKLRL